MAQQPKDNDKGKWEQRNDDEASNQDGESDTDLQSHQSHHIESNRIASFVEAVGVTITKEQQKQQSRYIHCTHRSQQTTNQNANEGFASALIHSPHCR
mmetsp:Transcript_10639/g.30393  ORF Transcript_10639/g.30393 Transcript_10639/m.30393 type:complete len:98 (+) Transcript_10639:3-296(+)